jgi:hypothetical protein
MHYGNVAYRGQRQASRKQESKQARKREALVKGTRGRQEKRETSQLCEQAPFRAPLLAQRGLDGTELDRYHLP